MKKFARWALAVGLCLTLLVCGALATDAADIAVQLDGQNLAFTDAVPQVKDQRTFLPFRAVFEAMGAQVDYEGSVITAVRGDKTLTMTLDSTQATVVKGGVTTSITMDVAPYVDPATWRTYVPVRFAAQAFDCVVGWDQEAQTAIVIDAEKLVDAAMEGKSFTYLEKLAAMNEKYNEGIWDMTATFDADISMMTVPMLTMNGDVKGTVQDSDKMSMDMNMKMDLSGVMLMAGGQVTAEDQAVMDAMKTDGMDLTMRGDMATGKLYINMDLSAMGQAAAEGFDSAAWYELDMAEIMKQSGMEWADVMTMSRNMDMLDVLTALLSTAEPTSAATAYADMKTAVENAIAAFCDQGFVLEDGQYVAAYAVEEGDATATLALVLEMDGEAVKSYAVGMDMTAQAEGQSVEMSMTVAMDDKDQMNAELTMDMGGLMTMNMTMEGAYAPGTAAPVIAPPEGATVIPFTQLMGELD